MLAALLEPLETAAPSATLPTWLLPHQADAVIRAAAILRRFGGVLVADGVGLGKTFIALALAVLERTHGGDAVVFVPAALRTEWRRAAASVDLPLTIHSHATLARSAPALSARCSLVIVDEAHAFRNPRTRRYDALARLAAGRRVALLTATPLNNTPADLAALVRLFAARDRFREFGVADIEQSLRRADPAAALALGAISVCRTRRLVEARFPQLRGAFPRRVLHEPRRYDLDGCYGGSLGAVLDVLRALTAADQERGAALAHLVMLRRLESSRAAFRRSLARQRDVLDEITRAAEQGVPVSRAEVRAEWSGREADAAQLLLWPLLSPAGGATNWDMIASLRRTVDRALELTDRIAGSNDPKADALLELLRGPLRGAPAIVFTEYRDTALHLLRSLRGHLRVIAVLGDSAWAGTSRLTRREALDAFAPRSRGQPANPLLEADVLVATDVASEGLNLQDARAVVNYDLPWNPVRVMQRVGRIERLHSPHQSIDVCHLLPRGGLRELSAVLRTLKAKLEAGPDAPFAEPDPLAALWWVDGTPDPRQVEEESFRRVAPFEARESWRALVGAASVRETTPLIAAAACAEGDAAVGVLLALEWRGGRRIPLPFVIRSGAAPEFDPQALGLLAARAFEAEPLPVDAASFTTVLASVLPEARARLIELSASRHGIVEPGPGRRCAIDLLQRAASDAWRLRRDDSTFAGALDALSADVAAGVDRQLARLTREGGSPLELAARISEVLSSRPASGAPLDGTPKLVLIAALLLAARCPSG